MPQDPPTPAPMEALLSETARLRSFAGPPAEFWPAYAELLARWTHAQRCLLIVGLPSQPQALRKLADWSPGPSEDRASPTPFLRIAPQLAVTAMQSGEASQVVEPGAFPDTSHQAIAVRLRIEGSAQQAAAVLFVPHATEAQAREARITLAMASDVPASYLAHHARREGLGAGDRLASVLDVLAQVNAEPRFGAALIALAHGIASQLACDRVSIGWLEGSYLRLKAISRTARFDPKMAVVQALEAAMEEALDQDEEVVWPPPPEQRLVARAHGDFARHQGVANMVSVPIRVDGRPVAVLTCERQEGAFADASVRQLRLACDQLSPRLGELYRTSGWLGARCARALRRHAARILGPEHTWTKVGGVLGVATIVALFLPIYPYRVEGTFVLRAEELSYLTAPFDGFIQGVEAKPGDILRKDAPLVRLNTDQLELEEAAAIADQTRFLREAEKARAARQLAEMRIAQSQADQAAARLGLVRHRLGQATLKAPFDGIVAEGDLRQRISAPVRQGDALLKVARIDRLYVEVEIHERDVQEVLAAKAAEVAFVAQPRSTFPVQVAVVEPSAQPKPEGNVFRLRASLASQPEPWFRPGMSGVCKVPSGKRTLAWILAHRTIDFLRMYLWW